MVKFKINYKEFKDALEKVSVKKSCKRVYLDAKDGKIIFTGLDDGAILSSCVVKECEVIEKDIITVDIEQVMKLLKDLSGLEELCVWNEEGVLYIMKDFEKNKKENMGIKEECVIESEYKTIFEVNEDNDIKLKNIDDLIHVNLPVFDFSSGNTIEIETNGNILNITAKRISGESKKSFLLSEKVEKNKSIFDFQMLMNIIKTINEECDAYLNEQLILIKSKGCAIVLAGKVEEE